MFFSPSLRTKKIDSTRRYSPSYNNKVLQLDAADATTRLFPSVSKLFIWTSFRPFFFCFPFTLHFRSNRKTAFEEQKEATTTEIISEFYVCRLTYMHACMHTLYKLFSVAFFSLLLNICILRHRFFC